jgi:zinc transport system substrate-binding protein
LAVLAQLPAWADVPAVVTDMPVTHSLVAMVMGDLGAPDKLLWIVAPIPTISSCVPRRRARSNRPGSSIWMGPEMAPWMARAVGALSDGEALELLEVEGLHLQGFQESRLTGEAAEHAHDP